MTIADKLLRLEDARLAIRAAIQAQGVSVPLGTGLEGMPAYIADIEGGAPILTAPAAFTIGQWTATAGDEIITVNITALPDDGGSVLTAIEYRIDGGSWIELAGGDGTGERILSGYTNGVEYDVEIRAVNAIGAGPASDVKSRTPASVGGTAVLIEGIQETTGDMGFGTGITPAKPAGTASSDRLLLIFPYRGNDSAILTVPTGWTLAEEVFCDFAGDIGFRAYWAAGNVADGLFVHSSNAGAFETRMVMLRISGASLTTPIRASDISAALGFPEPANWTSPTVDAVAGDLVIAAYLQPQSTTALLGAPTAGYTSIYNDADPYLMSILAQEDVAGGATGAISHNANAPYEARVSMTLVIRP